MYVTSVDFFCPNGLGMQCTMYDLPKLLKLKIEIDLLFEIKGDFSTFSQKLTVFSTSRRFDIKICNRNVTIAVKMRYEKLSGD